MTRPVRRAAILAIGSELLTSGRIDSNSLVITDALNAIGIDVLFKAVIGDDRAELAAAFAYAMSRVDVVMFTGGLGPTEDDLTREAVAAELGLALHEDHAITHAIRKRFEMRGWKMPEINRRQAMVPEGAVVLANPHGTAPGLWIEARGKCIALMPGPPREMKPMLAQIVEERLKARAGGTRPCRRGARARRHRPGRRDRRGQRGDVAGAAAGVGRARLRPARFCSRCVREEPDRCTRASSRTSWGSRRCSFLIPQESCPP